jgi:uncharacterized lipoprotein NlpE involved in copper resistance
LGAGKLSASQSQSKQAKQNVKTTQDGLCVCMDCAYTTTTVRFLNILWCASLSLPQIPTRLHKVYKLFAQESTQSPRFKRKKKRRKKAKYFLPFFSVPHHLPTQ